MEIDENNTTENSKLEKNIILVDSNNKNIINEKEDIQDNNKLDGNDNEIKENNINDNNKKDKNNENEMNDYEINEDYDYEDYDNNDNIDNVETGQEEILETMFINAKNSVNEDKISLYLDIVSLDESKEKVWSYKCYQEICLIYLQFEDHLMFPLYYKKLMEMARTFDPKKLRPYVEQTVTIFLNEIKVHCKESINHWLEDLSEDFNRLQQDKVINMFEANINLKFLILSKGGDINNNKIESSEDNNEINNALDINIIDYLRDKDKLESLTNDYLIKECGCNPDYLDKIGNTFFYFQPENCRRGGEDYNVPLGWTAFGIEVTKRYGNTDWIANDGRAGEWAVAYHGFGCRMTGDQIKQIIKTIVHDNLRPGSGQAFSGARDRRHPGKLCEKGVYVTPDLNIATQYSGLIPLGGKNYRLIIMVRVNPNSIREPENQKAYWIVNGNSNELRPYRLLIREANTINIRRF